jgi:hypothetical protein
MLKTSILIMLFCGTQMNLLRQEKKVFDSVCTKDGQALVERACDEWAQSLISRADSLQENCSVVIPIKNNTPTQRF